MNVETVEMSKYANNYLYGKDRRENFIFILFEFYISFEYVQLNKIFEYIVFLWKNSLQLENFEIYFTVKSKYFIYLICNQCHGIQKIYLFNTIFKY